jgi:hypothetical protein
MHSILGVLDIRVKITTPSNHSLIITDYAPKSTIIFRERPMISLTVCDYANIESNRDVVLRLCVMPLASKIATDLDNNNTCHCGSTNECANCVIARLLETIKRLYPRTQYDNEILDLFHDSDVRARINRDGNAHDGQISRIVDVIHKKLFKNALFQSPNVYRVYEWCSKINHSCSPNCQYDFNVDGLLTLSARSSIKEVNTKTKKRF